ncbi:hypothetical protein AYO45_04475 [Gammaproteobacteria bacterium SCGC AG-212-F23]|nr:hypothetical protein AYO45_04475 [Gammaproteobacteria bacterium SCGC AG-212-F23]
MQSQGLSTTTITARLNNESAISSMPALQLVIRHIEEKYDQAMGKIIEDSIKELDDQEITKIVMSNKEDVYGLSRYFAAINQPYKGQYWVLTDKKTDHVYGGCGFKYFPNGICSIEKFYLAKEIRRKGYGQALLSYILDRAKSVSCTKACLITFDKMHDAINVYNKFGFMAKKMDANLATRFNPGTTLLLEASLSDSNTCAIQ